MKTLSYGTYEGEWLDSNRHGIGIFFWKDTENFDVCYIGEVCLAFCLLKATVERRLKGRLRLLLLELKGFLRRGMEKRQSGRPR